MSKGLRVAFLEGPGDVIGTFRRWREHKDDLGVTHVAFSRQFFDVCAELDAQVLVIGEHSRCERIEDGNFVLEHRGNDSRGKRHAAYHLSEIAFGARIVRDLVRFRPDVVIMGMRPYPFLIHGLRMLGTELVFVLHCVLWPKFGTVSGFQKTLLRMSAPALRNARSIMCVSEDIKRQVRTIIGGQTAPFVDFLPLFRGQVFDGIPVADPTKPPFRVMFAGRVERNKGVFDLLRIAQIFCAHGHNEIVFEICGSGSALHELQGAVSESGLNTRINLRGWCDNAQMRESFARSHVVVVPTTTDFVEGFNMVVVESLLAKRPVISSAVCPALEYVSRAAVIVPPDDVNAYAKAILDFAGDAGYYRRIQAMTETVASRFLEERNSLGAALRHTLTAIRSGSAVPAREIPADQAM